MRAAPGCLPDRRPLQTVVGTDVRHHIEALRDDGDRTGLPALRRAGHADLQATQIYKNLVESIAQQRELASIGDPERSDEWVWSPTWWTIADGVD